jgi:hypothetical protein
MGVSLCEQRALAPPSTAGMTGMTDVVGRVCGRVCRAGTGGPADMAAAAATIPAPAV